MKVSVSISDDELRFLDELTAQGRYPSRSAAFSAAIRELRLRESPNDYTEAYDEWIADGGETWEVATGDGID